MNDLGYDIDKIREFISRCEWKWSKTMENIPHEYIVRGQCALTEEEFLEFFYAQRTGEHEKWRNYNHQYIYIDGYKYWTMGDTMEGTRVMNRARVFDAFDVYDYPLPRIYDMCECEVMAKTILKSFDGLNIFECGFGNGDFVICSQIEPEKYYGVDPSRKAIEYFRKRTERFYRRCTRLSFEQAVDKWKDASGIVVIALFGCASYIMWEYLKKLNDIGLDYCLMFYREGYTPDEFKEMYQMNYSVDKIKSLFPKANIYNHKKYITVSSRKLDWQQAQTSYDLFNNKGF